MFFAFWVLKRRGFWQAAARSRWFSYLAGGILIAGVVTIGSTGPSAPDALGPFPEDGKTYAAVLDVGQGDAILIRTASGDDLLIDGGPDERTAAKIADYLPRGDRDLELVILTHPHADHLAGLLAVFEQFDVRRVVHSGTAHGSTLYKSFLRAVRDEGVALETARAGEEYVFGDTRLRVLHAGGNSDDLNDASIVALLARGESEVLLMGDATSRVEEALLKASSSVSADILKIGHHGSKYSTSRAFLAAVRPDAAVISVGASNNYGHPAERVLVRLRDAQVPVARTDFDGDALIILDGEVGRMANSRDRENRPGLLRRLGLCVILTAVCP